MLRNVFTRSLRDQRRALLRWSVGLVLLVVLVAAMSRSVPEMELAALYGAVLPILFAWYAIGRGARSLAGEEEAGTLDVVLVTGVRPASLVAQQAAALAVTIGVLGTVLLGAVLAGSAGFGLGIGVAAAAGSSLAMVLLGVSYGWLALAIGAATGRRGLAVAASAAAAVAGYLLYVADTVPVPVPPWQPLPPLQALSQFQQTIVTGPLGTGLPLTYFWLPLVGAVSVLVAALVLSRRDIAVH